MAVAVAMAVAVVMAVAVAGTGGVGTGLRQEGALAPLQPQPAPLEQIRQHRIIEQAQFLDLDLHRHMAVAQVIGGLQQLQGRGGPHQQQRLRRRRQPHLRTTLAIGQPFVGLQGLAPGQLQQQRLAATTVAQAPQAAALVGCELKDQRRRPAAGRRGQALGEHDGGDGVGGVARVLDGHA